MTVEFSKDFCLSCNNEMRKWIADEKCMAMCINKKCNENGIVYRAIQNHNNFKILTITIIDANKHLLNLILQEIRLSVLKTKIFFIEGIWLRFLRFIIYIMDKLGIEDEK